jgi:1-acyl-sn-glycerol-3-phosphate acyltransferase
MMVDFFGIQFKQLGPHGLYKGGRCMYLCNHRSWADFFIDVFLTQGLAAPMSRALVFYIFPFFMTSVWILPVCESFFLSCEASSL